MCDDFVYDYRKGLTADECFTSLTQDFGGSVPSRATVHKWFKESKKGRQSLEDKSRAGCLHTAVMDKNFTAVRKLITEDPHITYREIEATLEIESTLINTILHKYLQIKKICARWVPNSFTKEQETARVNWCHTMLKQFKDGKAKDIYNIFTGNETWPYHYEPETKLQSTVWCFSDKEPLTD